MTAHRKSILFLENAIGWGGAAICLKLMAEYLDKERFRPIISTPHCNDLYPSYGDVADWYHIPHRNLSKQRVEKIIRELPGMAGGGRVSKSAASVSDYLFNVLPYTRKLCGLAIREKVDLIHLNNEPVCNIGGILAAKLLGIPCISHVRGAVAWDSRTTRWLYYNVDHFITVADWVKKEVMGLGVPKSRVQTIWDGRKLDEFERPFDAEGVRVRLGLKVGDLAVGMVGRLNPWKGHRVFIDAARIIEERFPGCRLFIIGGSSETYREYEKELKELVREKNLSNVVFTGQRDDIPDVMRVLDIIVHASVEPDPYPNVVLEGMAAGRPVVATNIGGPVEMIEDGVTGMLVPPNEPAALADTIEQLLSTPDVRNALGRAARRVAFERYSIENHVRRIEEVYERVLGIHGEAACAT